jgi:hypothetical protein
MTDWLRTSIGVALAYLSGPAWEKSMADRRARYEAIWKAGMAKP